MKILHYSKEQSEEQYVRQALPEIEWVFRTGETITAGDASDAQILSVFTTHKVNADVLAQFPQLKLIVTRSTGYDHIDVAAATASGVQVANVPSYGENTVAEFAAALLLALSRNITDARERVRGGQWNQEGLEGFDLAGKTIGVIGTGRIGSHMVRIAHGFGMHVCAHDTVVREELVTQYQVEYLSLVELLKRADVVSVHVPNLPATHHLLNRDMFAYMKRGAYLINTARGAVVETEALIEVLESGVLAGAGLDVLEEESASVQTQALAQRDNVIVTPHVAFNTKEAKERILETTVNTIRHYISGTPISIVSSHK